MGTMRERSPGSWELTVSAGVDPSTGRYARVIRTVRAATKREARAALRRLEVEVASGQVSTEDPTFAELLERWMIHLEALGRSPATLYGYRRYVDRELVPTIGGVPLSKLTAGNLDGLYSSLRRRGLAPPRGRLDSGRDFRRKRRRRSSSRWLYWAPCGGAKGWSRSGTRCTACCR